MKAVGTTFAATAGNTIQPHAHEQDAPHFTPPRSAGTPELGPDLKSAPSSRI
jgi:hypothetical protein